MANECVLHDRKTDKKVDKSEEISAAGETAIGRVPAPTDADNREARQDAIRKAKLACSAKYKCKGRGCPHGCVMDVEVLEDATGTVVLREVPAGPAGVAEIYYLTYEVRVACKCRCAEPPPPRPPLPGSGKPPSLKDALKGGFKRVSEAAESAAAEIAEAAGRLEDAAAAPPPPPKSGRRR